MSYINVKNLYLIIKGMGRRRYGRRIELTASSNSQGIACKTLSRPTRASSRPAYFGYLSAVFSFLYLYIFVPLSIILESYILVAYSVNMVGQENIPAQSKFRRGVAVFLPFLLRNYLKTHKFM